MSFLNSIKLLVIFFSFSLHLNVLSQSDVEFKQANSKKALKSDSSFVDGLSSTEKYALKMLNKGYSLKSIALQTNLNKKRIKIIRKKYIK